MRALQYLARREYSRAELALKLRPYALSEEDVNQHDNLDELFDELTERGYLSDERAAAQLLHIRRPRFGLLRIEHEMRQKGFDDVLIENARPTLKEGELDAARGVWQKKFGILPHNPHEKARQMRFLQSRGFSMEVILKVVTA